MLKKVTETAFYFIDQTSMKLTVAYRGLVICSNKRAMWAALNDGSKQINKLQKGQTDEAQCGYFIFKKKN